MSAIADRLIPILARTASLPEAEIRSAVRVDPAWRPDLVPEYEENDKNFHFGALLISKKQLSEDVFYQALAGYFDYEFTPKIVEADVDLELVKRVPIQYAREHAVLPIRRDGDSLKVATAMPQDQSVMEDLEKIFGALVEPVVTTPSAVEHMINRVYDRATATAGAALDNLNEDETDLDEFAGGLEEPKDLLEGGDDEAPVIRLINTLLYQAVKERASDIHVEPQERDIIVRYRIDGVLHEVLHIPKRFQSSVLTRIKIMAGLNIAEKRLTQDGRIKIKLAGRDIDIRVATAPTVYGEDVVMRLLDKTNVVFGLDQIGITGRTREQLEKIINQDHGILLVTGPTGSGKSTTLYASLMKINNQELKIVTIEDPVEYQITGISQTQVNPKIDLTFASGLRSMLRRDPDVIMVGEIRDRETAEIAIHASLTGHLVFSTLHTNDSASSIARLVDMGIEPFLVASSVLGIMAQRLARRLCPDCKEAYSPPDAELAELGIKRSQLVDGKLYRAKGCDKCQHTGYRGRTGIYELLVISDTIREHVMKGSHAALIKKTAQAEGLTTLREDGIRKIIDGVTTTAEIMRVTQEELA
ncbi:MAG: type II secretion system ATPase GspE [Deltaproteobacteria bacterium]|nr:type II secretion system ATPase GspE [Deltaproteobacteria bacterium]